MNHPIRYAFLAASLLALPAQANVELTEEFLEGPWCLEYMENDGVQDPQNVSYVFQKGGSFSYQASKSSDKMSDGSYEIDGTMLKLKPTRQNLEIVEIGANRIVAMMFMRLNFARGNCT